MVVPISSEFLLVWRWLISRVLNTMQTAHNAHVMASVTSHQAGTSSLITWTWHGGNFLETLLTSDIWIQFNQIFMSSDRHYQGNDQRRLFTARWCYSTLEIIRTFCKSHLTGHTSSPLNLVCGVPAINALGLGLKLNKQKYVWLNSWSPSVWAVSGVSGRCVKLHPLLVPSYNIITTCAAQWNVMTTASNLLLYTLDIMLCMLGICQWIACFWYVRGS